MAVNIRLAKAAPTAPRALNKPCAPAYPMEGGGWAGRQRRRCQGTIDDRRRLAPIAMAGPSADFATAKPFSNAVQVLVVYKVPN